jgi:hypothetical protein
LRFLRSYTRETIHRPITTQQPLALLLLDSSALPIGRSCFIGAAQHKSHSHSYIANVAVSVSASFIKQPWKEIRNYAANRKKKYFPSFLQTHHSKELTSFRVLLNTFFLLKYFYQWKNLMVCYRVLIISQYGSL